MIDNLHLFLFNTLNFALKNTRFKNIWKDQTYNQNLLKKCQQKLHFFSSCSVRSPSLITTS